MQLIKEKFLSNFKNKERHESLEKALMFFEKYKNFQNPNNQFNHSFSKLIHKPLRFLTSQKTNSMSIFDNFEKKQNKGSYNKLEIDYVSKSNENALNKYKKEKINNNNYIILKYVSKEKELNKDREKAKDAVKLKDKEKKIINKKVILKKLINRHKELDKTKNIQSDKNDKKRGFFIRKVIREEKYIIDNDGKEKLVGVKQQTFDTQEKKDIRPKKENLANICLKYNNKNITLLNKKKFTEFFKNKISLTKDINSLSLQNKNKKNNNIKNKSLQINTDQINNNDYKTINKTVNKTVNNDGYNNIKIVINKINKINSNPKINLNFIKKYKIKKNKEQNIITRNNLNAYENMIYQTQANNNSSYYLMNCDNFLNDNMSQYRQPIRINTNFNSYQSKIISKGNIKILKCEKFGDNQSFGLECFNTQKRQNSNKRNYSYKEIKNLSNSSNNNIEKDSDIYNFHYNKTEKTLITGPINYNNLNHSNEYRTNNIPNIQNIKLNKNRHNHTFYESKSFSNKKNMGKKPSNNFINYDYSNYYEYNDMRLNTDRYNKGSNVQMELIKNDQNKTINPDRIYFYQHALNNYFDLKNIKK